MKLQIPGGFQGSPMPLCSLSGAAFLILCATAVDTCRAQGRSSFGLYNVNASAMHFFNPNRNPYALSYSPFWSLGNDTLTTVKMNFGATWARSNSMVVFRYTPQYTRSALYPEGSHWNHAFAVNGVGDRGVRLSDRWRLEFGLNAGMTDFRHYFLSQTEYSRVVAAAANPDELAAAFLDGQVMNDELASALTATPLIETPASFVVFGNRMFFVSGRSNLTYAHSQRLNVSFGVRGVRNQHLSGGRGDENAAGDPLIPHSTNAGASVRIGYSLSPRSSAGANFSTSRTFSAFQRTYSMSGSGNYSRRMSPNWFLAVHAGMGRSMPLNEFRGRVRSRLFAIGGVTIGYGIRSHAFVASAARSLSEEIGVGAGTGLGTRGAWSWRPGRGTWQVMADFSRTQWQRDAGLNMMGWRASASVGRMLTGGLSWTSGFFYMKYSGPTSGGRSEFALGAIRTGLTWAPGRLLGR